MLKNYFRIAIRNLGRNKIFSFINIFGLTIGLTGSSLLLFYLNNELSYDKFHSKASNIARVVEVRHQADGLRFDAATSAKMGTALNEEFSGIVNQTNVFQPIGHIDIEWKGERISERKWAMVDSTFFQILDFEFVEGDIETALNQPNSIILSESTAAKYFGNDSPIGELMTFSRLEPMKVTGVIKDMPANSHLQLDVILSRNTGFSQFGWWEMAMNSWDILFATTYVELSSPKEITAINESAEAFVKKIRGENVEGYFYLQPIEDIYLNSQDIDYDLSDKKGDWMIIYLFGAIALFLIVIACINYINLATSKSMERAKEIGIRKVSGAVRSQLVYQFLSESMIISILAFLLSIILVDVLIPYFNQLSGAELVAFSGNSISLLFVLTLVIGFISGCYPAFYLSKLKPSESLRGTAAGNGRGVLLRKVLVITQFSLSIFMIAATIVVSKQMSYLQDKNLGFDKDQLLIIDINNGNVRQSFEAMKNEFSNIGSVKSVSASSRVPGEWKNITEVIAKMEGNSADSIQSYFMCFDKDVLATFSLQLNEGSNFLGQLATDSTSILINETAAAKLGGASIGQQIILPGTDYPFKIIGIVKDFNFQSLHQDIAPLIMGYWFNPITSIDYFALKLGAGVDISKSIQAAKEVHQKFDNSTPMEYHFLDQQLNLFYKSEQRANTIFKIGAAMTILIACLGLFGLASFVVQKRTKEISVRKVLGASVLNLFVLLSKTFVFQVLIAFIIASPIAWYFMNKWLENFAFKFELGIQYFLYAGLIAMIIALISVSYRVINAALLNPSKTLKNE